MPPEPADFAALAARFERLGQADRQAVLGNLSTADRERVLAELDGQAQARDGEAQAARRAGRQYAAYSPWLAEIVRRCCAGETAAGTIGEAARQAIAEAHGAVQADEPAARGLVHELRGWWHRALDPGTARP